MIEIDLIELSRIPAVGPLRFDVMKIVRWLGFPLRGEVAAVEEIVPDAGPTCDHDSESL